MSEKIVGTSWPLEYSKDQVSSVVENQVPRISSITKHWERYNIATQQWEDTGILATVSKALPFTVTLSASGWSNNTQTISNASFVVSGYSYVVSSAPVSVKAYAEAQIYADDVTTAGQMTFHCGEVPSAALTVNILRVEVQ